MKEKEQIIELFRKHVKGKSPDIIINHDGAAGHWLERQFGIAANADNKADILGFELKTDTTSKITFGDWSANRYIFTKKEYSSIFKGNNKAQKQDSFLRIFGRPNPKKKNRYSWSGTPCPKIHSYNSYGQKLIIDETLDIVAIYNYDYDTRVDKNRIIPHEFQVGVIEVARWFGKHSPTSKRTDKCLREKLEDKFNQNGWFTCKKSFGVYDTICFGNPINFSTWINWVASGEVFLDSGMYEGNDRPYSQWRMNNKGWDKLITEKYQ